MLKRKIVYSCMIWGCVSNAQASQQSPQILQLPKSLLQVGQPEPMVLTLVPQKTPLVAQKLETEVKVSQQKQNTQYTLPRDGQPVLNFNLVEAARLENNDLLFSIIRNKETLSKIMGRTVLQAELNTLANVRQKIFGDVRANLDNEYESYVGKTGTTKKTKLRDHPFASIIANTNAHYQGLLQTQCKGIPLKTAEETLQFILNNKLSLDSFFAEVISALYGLNVQVLTSSPGKTGELKEILVQPVFLKAKVNPLFVLHSGVGSSTHFDKLYPENTSGHAKSEITTAPVVSKALTPITQTPPMPVTESAAASVVQTSNQTIELAYMQLNAKDFLAPYQVKMSTERESKYKAQISLYGEIFKSKSSTFNNSEIRENYESTKNTVISQSIDYEKDLLVKYKLQLTENLARELEQVKKDKEEAHKDLQECQDEINKGGLSPEEITEIKEFVKECQYHLVEVAAMIATLKTQQQANEQFFESLLNGLKKENEATYQKLFNEFILLS